MLIAIANQPINNAEREDRGCECQDVQRVCFGEIENDDLSADGEQCNHDNRADLDEVSRRSSIAQLPIAGQYLDLWWRTNLSNPNTLVEWLRGANIENLTSWTGAMGARC